MLDNVHPVSDVEVEETSFDVEVWLEELSDREEVYRLSDLAEQYEWQQRLEESTPDLSHTCVSCIYYNRAYRPAVNCAVHPVGVGVAISEPNDCPDWQSIDLTRIVKALEQELQTHPVTADEPWMVLRVAYLRGGNVRALVRVGQELHHWSVWEQPTLDLSQPVQLRPLREVEASYIGRCWKNLGAHEQFVIWVNPVCQQDDLEQL